jgi:hypothetical protein
MMMRVWWLVVLWAGCLSAAETGQGFEQVLRGWQTGDYRLHDGLNDSSYANFSDVELRRLLPELTKWIPLMNELAAHEDGSWRAFKEPHEWTPFWNKLPLDHPLRVRWGRGMAAASILAFLAESGRLEDESVIPALIEGLENPDGCSTGHDCFRTLTSLTKLYDGPLTSWAYVQTAEERRQVSDWFRAWQRKMAGKQMIVTKARMDSIKAEFLAVTRMIETHAVKGHALHGYKSPDENIYHKVGEPLFDSGWTGVFHKRASINGVKEPAYGEGWMFACVRLQTSLLHDLERWNRYEWDTTETFPKTAMMIFSRKIAGTDWAIEVYTKDVPYGEILGLKKALAGAK